MPGQTYIQIAGSGFRIGAQRLREEFERPGGLRRYLQKYLLANLIQSAQNAACNRVHPIAERLARWLLTCHDRVRTDRMPLTHEFLAAMLGTPRTTVTLAAGTLHKAGLIDYSRGHVTIKNRQELEGVACECYPRTFSPKQGFDFDKVMVMRHRLKEPELRKAAMAS